MFYKSQLPKGKIKKKPHQTLAWVADYLARGRSGN